VEERMEVLRTLAAEKTQAHRLSFVGRELEAISCALLRMRRPAVGARR
jgi:hypothetical protein